MGKVGSPPHIPASVDELYLASGNYLEDLEEVISLILPSLLVPPSSKSLVSPESPPSLPLPPLHPKTASSPALPLLVPFSSPLAPFHSVDLPRAFQSPAPQIKEYPSALPLAADSVTSPRSVDLTALPWLLTWLHIRPSSLRLHQAPSGSALVRRRSACATDF